jgi:hypothetical protein
MKASRAFVTHVAFLSVAFLSAASLAALEWPVEEVRIRSFFGQRDETRISRGIALDGADIVRAAGNGQRIISIVQNRNMTGFPSTLGNAVIIAHDDGLLSVYGNLASVDRVTAHNAFETGAILGSAGSSGWTKNGELLFQVIDKERKTVLNPMLVLPSRPDSRGPVIKNVIAVSDGNQTASLGAAKYVRQGQYRLYADISDTVDGSQTLLAPFRVSVLVNGSEAQAIPFEVLRSEGGKLFLDSPEYTTATLYADAERMFLGEITLNRGRADITVIARDTAGNERSVLFSLQIE